MNISLGRDTWTRLTLPVKLGGFGLQSPIELAPSAFIAAFVSCSSLATSLFNNHSPSDLLLREALSLCESMAGEVSSINAAMTIPLQKQWTNPVSKNNLRLLIEQSAIDLQKARLQRVNCPDAGDWLNALPSNPLALCLQDDKFGIACGIRLGAPVSTIHRCLCGSTLDYNGTHALVCPRINLKVDEIHHMQWSYQ